MSLRPTLLVHGIWDTGQKLSALEEALLAAGAPAVRAVDLVPNSGRAPIPELAAQLDPHAEALLEGGAADRLDVVGFSMGALVSRYWIQRRMGRARTRRFISISGPQQGTATAYGLPFEGVRQMRPSSELLRSLEGDEDPWGEVEVHAFWTPYDLMILPPRSSRLPGAEERLFEVWMHRFMITDKKVIEAVVEVLGRPEGGPTGGP